MRALVAHISCDWCGLERELCNEIAAAMEMIHVAALLHDDIIDQAEMRRDRTTAFSEFGGDAAVLAGDFLYSRASQILCRADSLALLQVIADATNKLAMGEVMQLANKGTVQSKTTYMTVIERKTAALFGACAMTGPTIIGDVKMQEAMRLYGINLGITFQIADDCLDYIGDNKLMGKKIGLDFAEGKVTLPLIFGLDNDKVKSRLENLLAGTRDHKAFFKAKKILSECGALEQALEVAREHANNALAAIATLPQCDFASAMSQTVEKALHRVS